MRSAWVEAGSLSWRVRFWGEPSSPPILLLHGFTWDGASWEHVAERLAENYFCLAPDLPGHGTTAWPRDPSTWSFDRVTVSLGALVEAVGILQPALVGYSQGGRLALAMAAREPDRYARMVLVGASAGLATAEERQQRREADARLAEKLLAEGMEQFLEDWMALPLFESMRSLPEDVLTALRLRRLTQRPDGLATALRILGTGSQPYFGDRLPDTSTLLVVGERDAKFRAIAEGMRERMPGYQLALVEGAGHAVPFERPEALADHISEFMTGAPVASSLR